MSLEIVLREVCVSRGGRRLLDGVSWRLAPGGRHLAAGDNGAGKSTLLRLARGDIWPDQLPGGGFAGERVYLVDGRPTPSPIPARERIRLAGADLRDRYRARGWSVAAWRVVVSGLTDTPLPSGRVGQAQEAQALDALESLGLGGLAARPFLELSQGRAMAVLLARALVSAPDWIFLDEADDGLDQAARRALLDTLERLSGRGVGLVLASHHPEALAGLGFETLHLERGRVVQAPGQPQAPPAPPLPDPAGPLRSPPANPAAAWPGAVALLELDRASLTLGGNEALAEVSWRVLPGENWLVTGANGAGKSSLLKLLSGDLRPSSGRVRRFGLPDTASLWDLRTRMGMVSWEGQADWPEGFTVDDVLVSGFFGSLGLYAAPTQAMREAARAWLERLGLARLSGRPFATLSQGQARRAMIGRALAFDPPMLLLDEPLGGLDRRSRHAVLDLLDALAARGRQLVMVTHTPREIPRCITHALALEVGRVTSAGPATL